MKLNYEKLPYKGEYNHYVIQSKSNKLAQDTVAIIALSKAHQYASRSHVWQRNIQKLFNSKSSYWHDFEAWNNLFKCILFHSRSQAIQMIEYWILNDEHFIIMIFFLNCAEKVYIKIRNDYLNKKNEEIARRRLVFQFARHEKFFLKFFEFVH